MFELEKKQLRTLFYGISIPIFILLLIFVYKSNEITDSFWRNLLVVVALLYSSMFAFVGFFIIFNIIYAVLNWSEQGQTENSRFNLRITIITIITILVVIITAVLVTNTKRAEIREPKTYSRSELQDFTVYITNTGSKYHLEDCPTLVNKVKRIKSLPAAADDYEPCAVCNPPKY